MSLLQKLREEANREADPEIRARRLAKIAEVERSISDFEKQHAKLTKELAELQRGRRSFFSWTEFALGLGVVAVMAVAFYFELSAMATIVLMGIVALLMTGVLMLRATPRTKKIEKQV